MCYVMKASTWAAVALTHIFLVSRRVSIITWTMQIKADLCLGVEDLQQLQEGRPPAAGTAGLMPQGDCQSGQASPLPQD